MDSSESAASTGLYSTSNLSLLQVTVDSHIYSLFDRPSATSLLVRQARQKTLLRDVPDPFTLADELSIFTQYVLQASEYVDAVDDVPLYQMFTQMSLHRTRIHTFAVQALGIISRASRAITDSQRQIFEAIIHGETTEALIRLTRADDLALSIVSVCSNIVRAHNDSDRDRAHDVRKEAIGCSARLLKARESSCIRIRALEKEKNLARELYHDVLEKLKVRADRHGYATKVEREASQSMFMASGAVGVANVLTCLCGRQLFRKLFEDEAVKKEKLATAQSLKCRLIDEKLDLRKMLRVHADAMSKSDMALGNERRRVIKYSQAAAAANKVVRALEVIDEVNQSNKLRRDGDCSICVITIIKNAVDALRVQGSHISTGVLQLGVKTMDITGQDGETCQQIPQRWEAMDEEFSEIAELLLRFYAGWGCISDFSAECVYYVNQGGTMTGQRRCEPPAPVDLEGMEAKNEKVGPSEASSSSPPRHDELLLCTEELDALILGIKSKFQEVDNDADL